MTYDLTLFNKYFTAKEFEYRLNLMNPKLLYLLGVIREELGQPMRINSSFRTPEENVIAGGAKTSQHQFGKAVDIRCNDAGMAYELVRLGFKHGMTGIGVAKSFIHYDVRDGAPKLWTY